MSRHFLVAQILRDRLRPPAHSRRREPVPRPRSPQDELVSDLRTVQHDHLGPGRSGLGRELLPRDLLGGQMHAELDGHHPTRHRQPVHPRGRNRLPDSDLGAVCEPRDADPPGKREPGTRLTLEHKMSRPFYVNEPGGAQVPADPPHSPSQRTPLERHRQAGERRDRHLHPLRTPGHHPCDLGGSERFDRLRLVSQQGGHSGERLLHIRIIPF